VFSPYYAFARRLGAADPLNHCALNVAVYGADRKYWAMTERRRGALTRTEDSFTIGPSAIEWDGYSLTIRIDEVASPLPSRLRGTVKVHPSGVNAVAFMLDTAGRHRWWPIAPCSRVQVELQQPQMRWLGEGYFDINHGDAPLEKDFAGWEWSRASTRKGTVICYDTSARDGADTNLALRFDRIGAVEAIEPSPRAKLPSTRWRIARSARGDAEQLIKVKRTLEDAPFYARSQLSARLFGETVDVMHESLSLDRFRRPIVQAMLPFRMPRR
jgi:carotenoid 1,2-hydratase